MILPNRFALVTVVCVITAAAMHDSNAQAVQFYEYQPDRIYPVRTGLGITTQIELSPHEKILDYSTGFSTGWELTRRDNVFYLKPKNVDVDTNMMVRTETHSYIFELKVVATDWKTLEAARNRAALPLLRGLNPVDPANRLKAQAIDAGAVLAASAAADGLVQGAQAAARTAQWASQTVTRGLQTAGDGISRTYDSFFGSLPVAPAASPPLLNQRGHPDHALFKQAQSCVHRIDAQNDRAPDQRSDQLAAALVVAARRDGLSRIDHLSLATDASNVFAVQGELASPFKQIACVATVQSLNTPIAQSTQALQQLMQQEALESQQQHLQHQALPRVQHQRSGPAM
ncbi:TrbG/VirB9 family P-type conjugative transfer protein [Variovorax sp. J22R24]|uniref:XVIPCD domain-containing protein n=1 Tax=Variovorax gracilis TaxID=3053502 RepID=UPI00257716C2|nr:XVIPCD domain-containing protein [Variovorax sp. J22R24]MDM0104718.1 TrbG/VirB9 family P-type conjugative transfer protein [Variovorax sp. J22R24]